MTGRALNDLAAIFPERGWFDLAVMENGAMLFHPTTQTPEALADPPPSEFVARLHERGLPLQLGLEPAEVAGVGDAENDHTFLDICGLSVAVANALRAIKDKVQLVAVGDHGGGVVELIERLLPAAEAVK